MIKILFVGMSSMVGGVETYLLNLYDSIDRTRFRIDFLVQDSFEGPYKEHILREHGKIYQSPNFKHHPIKTYQNLAKLYAMEQYDVIHVNLCNASSILYSWPAVCVSKKTKIIAHSHSSSDKSRIQHFIFRPFLNKIVTLRLACSDLAAEWMFGKKYKPDTVILKNAIQMSRFQYNENTRRKVRKQLGIENNFVIGHVGRFSPEKNHLFLIRLFEELYYENKSLILLLVGTGPLVEKIRKEVSDLGLEKSVLFLGECNNVNELYQAMDLFLLPSVFEGLPIAGVEAQASGLNCIFSSNISKQAAVTKHVVFLPIDSKDIWIENIKESPLIYKRSDVTEDIKRNGFDMEYEIKKLEDLYLFETRYEKKNN